MSTNLLKPAQNPGGAVPLVASQRAAFLRRLPVVMVALIGVAISLVMFKLVRAGERKSFWAGFERHAAAPAMALQRDVDDYLHLLRSIQAFYQSSRTVDRAEFAAYTESALKRLPGLETLEWVPVVASSGRDRHEATAAAEGLAGYQIVEPDQQGRLVRAASRPEYLPIFFTEPAVTRTNLGFDLSANRDFAAAMRRARERNAPTASAPFTSRSGPPHEIRYRVFIGIQTNLSGMNSIERRPSHFAGYGAAVISIHQLMDATLKRFSAFDVREMQIQLLDVTRGTNVAVLLSQTGVHPAGTNDQIRYVSFQIDVADRTWMLRCQPGALRSVRQHTWESWGLLVSGLLVTLLMSAYLGTTLGRAEMVERLVDERTAELARINHDLVAEIDRRQRMELDLAAEREMITALLDNIPDHIYFKDRDSRFIRINRALAAAFRLKAPEEARGRTDFDFFDPEHARRAFDDEQTLMKTGQELINREEREVWPDGTVTWVSTNKQCLRDKAGNIVGTFGVSRDITDRKKADQRLTLQYTVARELAEARTFATAAPDILSNICETLGWAAGAIWIVDKSGGVLRCSEFWNHPSPALDEFGRVLRTWTFAPGVDLPGQAWQTGDPRCCGNLTDPAEPRATQAAAAGLKCALAIPIRAGTEVQGVIEFFSRNAEQKDEELIRSLVAVGNQVGLFLDRRRFEESLEEQAHELARSNKDLEQFAYVASHDLQEPLRMVASYTQLIERRYKDKLDADGRDFIRYTVEGANRMQTLINDLLTYSRVGTRKKPFVLVDCNDVVRKVMKNLEIAISESQAVVECGNLPKVFGDPTQLAQLFQNLIGNGIKFCGGKPARVQVSAELKEGPAPEWIFTVRDEGIGIEPQYFERIFVLFQRLHTREEYPGTGIGLAMCKRIVERHGGRIWLESNPGQNTTFFFTIPSR